MSSYDDDSDFGACLSDDDDDGTTYIRPSGARSKDRPRYEPSRRTKNHFGAAGLEHFDERPIRRSHTHTFGTDHTDSKALTLRGDRRLSSTTTAPGRSGGGPIQRRHTFDDEETAHDYRQPYSPRGESSHRSSRYINRGDEATSFHIHGGHQTFIQKNVHIHVPPYNPPAPGPSYTFSGDDDDFNLSRRGKGKTRADRVDDDYQHTRSSRPRQVPSVTEEPTAKNAGNKALRNAAIGRFADEFAGGAAVKLLGKLFDR